MHRSAPASPETALKKSDDETSSTPSSRVQSAPADSLTQTENVEKLLFGKPERSASEEVGKPSAKEVESEIRAGSEGEKSMPVSPARGHSSADECAVASPTGAVLGDSLLVGYHNLSKLDNVDLPSYVREHSTTLSFPEKLMLMLIHVERIFAKTGENPAHAPITWVADGQAFVIRDKAKLCSKWLSVFFRQAKFSSFTRKLYRWGFRQVNLAPDSPQLSREMFFGNENFQRDNTSLLSNMRSITAAGRRREQAAQDARQIKGGPESHLPGLTPELSQLLQTRTGLSSTPSLPSLPQFQTHARSASLPNIPQQHSMTSNEFLRLGGLGDERGINVTGQAALALQAQSLMAHHQLSLQPHDHAATRQLLSLSRQPSSFISNPSVPTSNLAAHLVPPLGSLPFHLANINQQQILRRQQQQQQQSQQQLRLEEQQRLRAVFAMFLRNNDSQFQQKPPPPPRR